MYIAIGQFRHAPGQGIERFPENLLQPGETRTVALDITPESLAFYDVHMKYVVEPGEFEIMVGNSSRDADLQKGDFDGDEIIFQPNNHGRAFHQKLSFFEKAGYSAADAAANFVFMTMILFQTNFYTDVFGLTPGAAAPFCCGRGCGTPSPIRSWGAGRPHQHALGQVPPVDFVHRRPVVRRHGPGLHHAQRLEHGRHDRLRRDHQHHADDHLLHEQHALRGAGRRDDRRRDERAKLNSFRFIAVNAAQFIVGGFTLPLVAKFAVGHDRQYGWQ
jgi:hypothetical protein